MRAVREKFAKEKLSQEEGERIEGEVERDTQALINPRTWKVAAQLDGCLTWVNKVANRFCACTRD